MSRQVKVFEKMVERLTTRKKWEHLIIAGILLPAIYFIVYFAGGSKTPYTHLMYIAIVYSGFALGGNWGFLIGIFAGLLMGPILPLDTALDLPQNVFPWVFRLFMFAAVGQFCGASADSLKKNLFAVRDLVSRNHDTHIPTLFSLNGGETKRTQGVKGVIITVLVDNYESIIDLLGKEVYDHLLGKIYSAFLRGLPEESTIVQGASDKFWITKPFASYDADTRLVTGILAEPLSIADVPLYVEFSIGLAETANLALRNAPDLYRQADVAARNAQKNNLIVSVFDEKTARKRTEIELLSTFLKALDENQTFLVYQPVIDLKTMKTQGVEALIRWTHPTYGMIMPDLFIPLIEGTELVHALTDWVMKTTVEKILDLEKQKFDLMISINVSAKNLNDPHFSERMESIIKKAGVHNEKIIFELTESAIMANLDANRILMEKIIGWGSGIALDDFGKGNTSLAYLSSFPIRYVKLDQYFMRKLVADQRVRLVVKTAIDLSHDLGCQVVAEGIEDQPTADICRELGCDFGQGFHFARPMTSKDLNAWLKNH